jgi:hypothetical protein
MMAFEDGRCLLLIVSQFIFITWLPWTACQMTPEMVIFYPLAPITDDRDEPASSSSDCLPGPELAKWGDGADREPWCH